MGLSLRAVEPDLVERIHAAGLKIYAYTVNKSADINKMIAHGVDGVFTNFPDRVFERLPEN